MRKIKLLWIEEETSDRLIERFTYIVMSDEYTVVVAEDATIADKMIPEMAQYDVILVDIRIPRGDNFQDGKHPNRLGLDIIKKIKRKLPDIMGKIGIYTNERWSDICEYANECGINERQFRQKRNIRTNNSFDVFLKSLANAKNSY